MNERFHRAALPKKLLLDTNHEILGDFERLLIRIIHEPQEQSTKNKLRPPDPKSILVLKYPTKNQNPPPQFGKLYFSKHLNNYHLSTATTETTERNQPAENQPLPGGEGIWETCTKIWMPRLIKAEST